MTDKDKDKDSLEEMKKEYLILKEKYSLPDFNFLNEDFQIERISEIETEYLLREIRKYIADKFGNYLRFIEAILNPSGVQMFVFTIVKTLGPGDKEKLSTIYGDLSKFEVKLLELDISYSEDEEAKFINDSYLFWQEVKKELLEIVKVIQENWNNKFEQNSKGYFG